MNTDRKKELKSLYREKPAIGGICCIRCSGNQRVLLQSTRDIESLRNRYDFAIKIQSCPDPSLRAEWMQYGIESFSFEVLEEIKKGDDQTPREFADDIKVLYEIWKEKYQLGELKGR